MYSIKRLKRIAAGSLILGFIAAGFLISNALPSTAAGAPAQITPAPVALAGDKSATITWTTPLDNGSPVTSYTVTSNPGALTCVSAALSCVVSGLSNETSYTFTVRPSNAIGSGPESPNSNAVVPTHLPLEQFKASTGIQNIYRMALSSDGTIAYFITSPSGVASRVIKFEISTSVIRNDIYLPQGQSASTVTIDELNGFLFVTANMLTAGAKDHKVYKFDLADMGFRAQTDGDPALAQGYVSAAAISPDGQHFLGLGVRTGSLSTTRSFLTKYRISDLVKIGTSSGSPGYADSAFSFATIANVQYVLFTARYYEGGTFGYNWVRFYSIKLSDLTAYGSWAQLRSSGQSVASALNANSEFVSVLSDGSIIKAKTLTASSYTASLGTSIKSAVFTNQGRFVVAAGYSAASSTPKLFKFDTLEMRLVGVRDSLPSPFSPVASALALDGKTMYTASNDLEGGGQLSRVFIKDIPSKPLSVSGQFGDRSATISWQPPSTLGSPTDRAFRVVASPGGQSCETSTLSCRVTNLTNGASYSFIVYPSNAEGDGIPSDSSAPIVPATVPSEPSEVFAEMGARQARVSWAPSDDDGGSAITYVVTASGGAGTCSTTATSCTVTGLTNGVAYTFSVRATNKAGSSLGVSSEETTPLSVPDPPTSVIALYGNAKATVSWQAPIDTGGLDIEGFVVSSSPAGGSCEASASDRSCEISGLTNGVSYTFRVVAKNSLGSSSTATSSAIIPRTTPGTPTVASVVPGNGTVQVTWTAPTSNGGAPILRYTARSIDGGRECTTETGSTLTCAVTGLTNGQTYTFTVKAINSEGDSLEAIPSSPVIPRTLPGAPTQVSGAFGNASATVFWTPPVDNGGASLVSHTVYFASTNTFACLALAPTNSCIVTGLLNGTSYTFYVRANNVAGAGVQSLTSSAITPATTPGAPTIFSVSASGNGQVSLAWNFTTVLGGAPITGHTVTAIPATGETKVLEVPYPSGSNSAVLTGLTTGVSYSFTVRTKNKAGLSVASAAWAFTPQAAPGAPTNVLAFPGDRRVTVRWTPPLDTGGVAITSYEVRNAVTNAVVCTSSYPVGTSCTTGTSLTNGSSYNFKVFALNGTPALFTSVASETSAPVVPRGVPLAPSITSSVGGDSSALISWNFTDNLTYNRGSAISSFIVYAQNLLGVTQATCETSAPSDRTCLVTGLTNGLTYRFKVAAVNAAGAGAMSPASLNVVPDLAPDAPSIISAVYGDQRVTVTWTLKQNGGSPNSQVSVISSPGGKYCTVSASQTSCAVEGLTNGTSYTFTVRARNASLEGPASPASNSVIPRSIPSAPTSLRVTPGNSQIAVTWSHVNTSGLPILAYVATASPGSLTCTTVADSCVISGLTNGTTYVVSVTALNEEGVSLSSATSQPANPRTVPSAPEFTSGTYASGRVNLSWSVPDSDGGSPITGYIITQIQSGVIRTYSASAVASSISINSLTNGLPYTFNISAQNSAGRSPESLQSLKLTPWGTPSAPSPITVTPRDGAVRVSWRHPVNTDPGTTTYLATANPGGQSCEVTGDTSCVVPGLTNGYPYVFSVVATNSSGSSGNSPSSISVTPAAVPGAPTDVMAEVGRLSALIYWIAPIDNGGAPIVKYTVSASGSSRTCVTATTSCQITGLTQGETYTFTVKATNAAGEGPASEPSDSLLVGQVPDAPNSVFGISGPNQVTVSWGEPANGGSAIDSYLVTSTPGGFICKSNGLLSCTIGGLANNVSYTFTVKAFNTRGGSDNSIASAPVVPKNIPGQPSDISTFFQSQTSLLVAWTPVVNLQNPVTKYQVDLLEPNYPFDVVQSIDVDSDALSVSFSGLTSGAAYRVQVTALSLTEEELGVVSLSAQNSALPAMLRPGSIAGTASSGSVLTLNSGNWIGNPLPVVTRTWYRCNNSSGELGENLPSGCLAISGATSLTYKMTATDVGKYILAGIKVSNSAGYVLVYTETTSVVKAPPALAKVQIITGTAAVGASLTTTFGTWVGAPAPELVIQWQRCTSKLAAGAIAQGACENIDGANSNTYTMDSADVGRFMRSAVVATNDGGSVASYSATTATAAQQRPTLVSAPSISGTASVPGTLFASPGSWRASPLPTYTYTWYRCFEPVAVANAGCATIAGASAASYKPTTLDIGKFLAVAVKAKNSAGESVASSPSTLAVRALPTSTLPPRIMGSYVVGNTVSAIVGSWTGSPTPTFSMLWQRCSSMLSAGNKTATNCVPINGATSADYELTNDDAGKYLRVVVSATNVAATTLAYSGTSTQIFKRPTLLQEPSILGPGGFKVRSTLTATNGSWSGVPTIAFKQQWYRCAGENVAAYALPSGCVLISGATRGTYVPVSADLGSYLIVSIEAKNSVSAVTRYSPTTSRITQ